MRKISVYIISLLAASFSNTVMAQVVVQDKVQDKVQNNVRNKVQTKVQDSVLIPLKIRAGIEISGPVIYFVNKNNLNYEGFVSGDLNEKISLLLGGGYSNYKYSQYNYDYLSQGIFIKAGADFNLFKPEMAVGKYWGGIGVHYGVSSFTSETPHFKQDNYWGSTSSSIAPGKRSGHFLEFSPGFRAELFGNLSIGWSISIRRLIYSGKNKDLRPVYIPGYGDGGKNFSTGISYFINYNIPFKKIKVPIKIEEPEEPSDTEIPTGGSSNR